MSTSWGADASTRRARRASDCDGVGGELGDPGSIAGGYPGWDLPRGECLRWLDVLAGRDDDDCRCRCLECRGVHDLPGDSALGQRHLLDVLGWGNDRAGVRRFSRSLRVSADDRGGRASRGNGGLHADRGHGDLRGWDFRSGLGPGSVPGPSCGTVPDPDSGPAVPDPGSTVTDPGPGCVPDVQSVDGAGSGSVASGGLRVSVRGCRGARARAGSVLVRGRAGFAHALPVRVCVRGYDSLGLFFFLAQHERP